MRKALCLSLLLFLTGISVSRSQDNDGLDSDADITFEVEDAGSDNEGVLDRIGRLHPMLVHFPVSWLVLLILCDVAVMLRGRDAFRVVSPYLLAITLISFVPALTTGWLWFEGTREYMDDVHSPTLHRNIMIMTFLLLLAAGVVRVERRGARTPGWAYTILTWIAVLCLTYAEDIGGEMVHGEGFLPF